MDLSLTFSSPQRQTSKFEVSFPVFKSKSYDSNVLPIPVPIENDSSNSMFDNSHGCRIARWMLPSYSSNCGFIQKSFHLNKNNTCNQKVMIPKIPSIALSFSQQTIVGGFVGSKSHAGRSFFGESSQLWDAVMCKFLELMSLSKDKPPDNLTESKSSPLSMNNSKKCDSTSQTSYSLRLESSSHKIAEKVSDIHLNTSYSSAANPECLVSDCIHSSPENNRNSSKCLAAEPCDRIKYLKKEMSTETCVNEPSTQRETYSSVVDRTCKNNTRCVLSESSPVEMSRRNGHPMENCRVSLPSPLKQSYAEVAKTIPHKPLGPQKRVGCEEMQNFKKRILHCKSNRDKRGWRGSPIKIMKAANNFRSPSMDDIITDGDTRWKADCKSKRFKLQRSHPISVPSRCGSSLSNEGAGKDLVEDRCSGDPRIGSENSVCAEAVKTEFPKCTLRGRYPSECSLDSEDSFVVFEDSPEVPVSSSPYSSTELSSSLEVDEEFADDESISYSDDSDSEDASSDNEDSLNDSPVAVSKLHKTCCIWGKVCSAYTVPDNASKVIKKKKVHFAEGSGLAVVRPMIAWGYAYRESRRGPWEIYARDRARFRCRIDNLAPTLNLILDPKHRKKILASRFSNR